MKRALALALVTMFAVGCAARGGGTRSGSSITRQTQVDDAQRDHASDLSQRPLGQR